MKRSTATLAAVLALALGGCHSPTAPNVAPRDSYQPGTIRSVSVDVRGEFVRFSIRASGMRRYTWQVFLNTDHNVHTGYGRFGSDYLVNGATPSGYGLAPVLKCEPLSWGPVTGEAPYGIEGDRLYLRIPRESIGGAASAGYRVVVFSGDGGEMFDYADGSF